MTIKAVCYLFEVLFLNLYQAKQLTQCIKVNSHSKKQFVLCTVLSLERYYNINIYRSGKFVYFSV